MIYTALTGQMEVIKISHQDTSDLKTVYHFGKTTNGNWRNALYINGPCEICRQPETGCGGFLFALSSEGAPLLLSVKAIAAISQEIIDPAECSGSLTLKSLMALLDGWAALHIDSGDACPLCYFNEFLKKHTRL